MIDMEMQKKIWKEKRFGVISLGCDKNRVDSEKLLGMLREENCAITNDPQEAQIIVVNTCGFLQASRQEAIDVVLECAEYKKDGALEKLVVTGCLPQKFVNELYEPLEEADVFSGTCDYELLLDAIEKSYRTGERVNLVGKGTEKFRRERVLTTDKHYAYLKIADGCYNRCTYCLIPKIRGKYRSYPAEELLEEARGLGELSELIVVAQDTTRYGEDLYGENKFVFLLRELSKLDNVHGIRLLYCYPEMIGEELIAEIKNNPKILKYLDIPLQHSEDRILKLMNRRGKRADYLSLFKRLRSEIPNIAIRSTFIAGFPTETEEEFENLKDFLKEADLFHCGFFAYSKEPDTAAARLSPQVHPMTKKRRVKELYRLQGEISRKRLASFIGTTLEVVCDGIDYEKESFVGRAYFHAPDIDGKVYFKAREAMQGERYVVKIIDADDYDLFGETEDYSL